MRKLFSIIIAGCCGLALQAQTLMNKDSLLNLLPLVNEDSAGVELYINLGQQYEGTEPSLAKYYYKKAEAVSKKINYPRGVAKFITNYTFVLNMQGRFDSSLALNLQSVEIARQLNDSLLLGKTLFNTGSSYRLLANYEMAAAYYEEGKKILDNIGDSAIVAKGNDILQLLYYNLEQYDKAIAYGESAAQYFRTAGDKLNLGAALVNLGVSYANKRNYKKALDIFKEAQTIGKTIGNAEMEAVSMLNTGDVYLNLGEYKYLKSYFSRALELYTKLGAKESMGTALRGMALHYMFAKDFQRAKEYGSRSLVLLGDQHLLAERKKTMETLSHIHFALHDINGAEKYLQMATVIADSVLSDKVRKNTLELEKKYESEKKQNRILKLEAENKIQKFSIRQKLTFNYILIGGAATLLIISLLSYRNYNQKKKIQQQRINELETEKQLTATEAVLKGEEQERTRLAKDLHDGLGGMLSGIKYSFNHMKENLIMTPDNQQAFERSMNMLDDSIKEMRRVAHNMMPESLLRYGLHKTLQDYVADLNKNGSTQIVYQGLNIETVKLDNTAAVTVYRIVQELINNTLKHAGAKNMLVQLLAGENGLVINAEDDGKGFDTKIIENTKEGIGWKNIKSRIEFLKGKLDVQSTSGKGTQVNIEITL